MKKSFKFFLFLMLIFLVVIAFIGCSILYANAQEAQPPAQENEIILPDYTKISLVNVAQLIIFMNGDPSVYGKNLPSDYPITLSTLKELLDKWSSDNPGKNVKAGILVITKEGLPFSWSVLGEEQ